MANPTDPNFLKGFSVDKFRQAITSAMEMGLPNAEEERLTFRWKTVKTFNAQSDRSGVPFDLNATPATVTAKDDVQVPGAVEMTRIAPDGTPIGQFDHPYAKITLLDIHWNPIKDPRPDEVLLGGNVYDISFVAPPFGLGEVTVYELYAIARDES